MLFATSGLLSKWGFSDGDLIGDLLWDHDLRGVNERDLLATVVERYVVPALDQKVETERIGTIHNPIRAVTVDGEEWGDRMYEPGAADGVLTPEYVEVPDDVILDLADLSGYCCPSLARSGVCACPDREQNIGW